MSPELRQYTPAEDDFSVGKDVIGGPKDHWRQMPGPRATWEFTNHPSPSETFKGYEFNFPKGSTASVWVEVEGKEEKYTLNGGQGAKIDSVWRVTKIELDSNPRYWKSKHEGQWTQWKHDGVAFVPGTTWEPIRQTPPPPPKRTTPSVVSTRGFTPEEEASITPPISSWTERDKQNAKRALKWALAGVIALGGIGVWSSMQKSQPDTNYNPYVPIVATEPTPTEPEYTYDTYDLKFGDTWTAPANSIVAIPYDSGIVVGPPAAVNETQISYSKVDGSWFAYDYIVINVSETPLTISTPSDPNLYTKDVIVEYNIKTRNNDSMDGYYDRKILGTDNILDFEYTLDFPDLTMDHNLCTGWPGVSCTNP